MDADTGEKKKAVPGFLPWIDIFLTQYRSGQETGKCLFLPLMKSTYNELDGRRGKIRSELGAETIKNRTDREVCPAWDMLGGRSEAAPAQQKSEILA